MQPHLEGRSTPWEPNACLLCMLPDFAGFFHQSACTCTKFDPPVDHALSRRGTCERRDYQIPAIPVIRQLYTANSRAPSYPPRVMTAELASPGRLLHIPQTFFDTNLNHLTSTYVYLAVPHTCRQKTLPATALSKVTHAFHACRTVCRRSSGNASGSKAVRLSSVPAWAISEAVMSRLRLAHLAVHT